jgi:hypothetical protein
MHNQQFRSQNAMVCGSQDPCYTGTITFSVPSAPNRHANDLADFRLLFQCHGSLVSRSAPFLDSGIGERQRTAVTPRSDLSVRLMEDRIVEIWPELFRCERAEIQQGVRQPAVQSWSTCGIGSGSRPNRTQPLRSAPPIFSSSASQQISLEWMRLSCPPF